MKRLQIEWFADKHTAWRFAEMLPKQRYEVINYGTDINGKYFVEYLDRPKYAR